MAETANPAVHRIRSMNSGRAISIPMQELSAYIASGIRRKLPVEVEARAKLHLVDTFSAMVSGSRLLPGRRAARFVKSLSCTRESGVVGSTHVTSAAYAALANGMCAHADESDDTHPPSRSHPGAAVVPAILAIAESRRLHGKLLLRALALGYDVCARLLLALNPERLARTGHNASAKGGLFGAAAATAALLKLDRSRIPFLLSYCAQQMAGLFTTVRDSQHIEKAYVLGGMPAHNGVLTALMVANGFTGVDDVLSGEPSLLSVFGPDGDRQALTRALGRDHEILRCAIKFWPAAGGIQGALHALYELMREHGINARNVDKLVVRLPAAEFAAVNNREMPGECIQHLLAIMLLDGFVSFRSAHDYERMHDPDVLELRRKHVQIEADPQLADPLRQWRCAMGITTTDGRAFNQTIAAAKGTSANALTPREQEQKAIDLMAPVLGKARSLDLISTLFQIERMPDARSLRKLYCA